MIFIATRLNRALNALMFINIFRLAGDLIRLFAVIALPVKLWTSRNCSDVSGKTQILFALVHTTRYLDLFQFYTIYHTVCKTTLILVSYLTVYLIHVKLRHTYRREADSFNITNLICIAVILAAVVNHTSVLLQVKDISTLSGFQSIFIEVCWAFSQYLETLAILPQLWMIYHDRNNETRSLIFYYVFALAIYRVLYLMNWVYKYVDNRIYDLISIVPGCVQLAIYLVFAVKYINLNSQRILQFILSTINT